MKNKVAIFGNYGVGNIGDDRMLKVVLRLVHNKGGEPVVFCGRPTAVSKKFSVLAAAFFPSGFRSVLRRYLTASGGDDYLNSKRLLYECESVVFGGGGLFVDKHFSSFVLWWNQLRKCLASKKRVIFMGVNFEISKWYSRLFWVPLLKKVSSIVVRDERSRVLLANYGIESTVLPDLTFLNVLLFAPEDDSKLVSFALRLEGLTNFHKQEIAAFVLYLKEEGYRVAGLVFQQELDGDEDLYKELGIEATVSGSSVFDVLSKSTFLVGMRYHSLVFAVQCGVPFIALAYQKKIDGFLRDIDFLHTLCSLSDISTEFLKTSFAERSSYCGDFQRRSRAISSQLAAEAQSFRSVQFLNSQD